MAKIKWTAADPFPPGVVDGYQRTNRRLGLPLVGSAGPVSFDLAVCGGSPSLADHLDTLRNWDGEVWAMNGTWKWLKDRGIDSTFYAVCPSPLVAGWAEGVTKAVVADTVDPRTIEALAGADIELACLGYASEGDIPNDCGAASTAPFIAVARGHKRLTFFGCDCSLGETSHVDRHEASDDLIRVQVGERGFYTRSDLLMIAEALWGFHKEFPRGVTARGSGFLPALIEHGDYDITHVPRRMVNV